MSNIGMIVMLVFAVCYMLFWGGIILFAMPKNQVFKKSKYDERQIAEQGKAFQYAYITLLCYLVLWMAVDKLFGTAWCEMTFGLFLGIGFSVSVFLAYCIFRDAYFSVGEHKAGALIGVNAIGGSQLLLAIESIEEGALMENGIVTADGIHLVFFAVVILADLFVIIRKRMEEKA